MRELEKAIHAVSAARASCYHTRDMRPRALTEATLVTLAAVTLTIALTYPVAFGLNHLGRINTDDGRWSIWVVSWVAHALTTRPLSLYHANIFYPHRYALAFSEANIGAGALGVPIWLLTGNPFSTHNAVLLFTFVLSFVSTYYLVRYLTRDRAAAAVCGVLFAFCPFVYARTAHVQLLFIGTLPMCMLAFHRLVDAPPSVSRAVQLGVALWATALSCAYYGIFAGLMVGLGSVIVAASRRRWRSAPYWASVGLAAFVSIGLTFPFFLPYVYVQQEMGFARTLDDARPYSANLAAWVTSSAWAHRWWLDWITPTEVLFPGFLTLALAAGGAVWLARHGRETLALYGSIAVIAFWSSFGPDAGLYRVFYATIPIFSFLRAPGRMGIMVTLALVVLAAPAIAWIVRRGTHQLAIAAALGVLAIAELAPVPLGQFREVEPVSPVYRLLATLPRGAVAEFPYWYQRPNFPRHAYYMLRSTAHWQPLVNGYSDHIPDDFRQTVIQLSSFPSRESFFILGQRGARYVVFHLDMYDARSKVRLMERLDRYAAYLRPLLKEDNRWLFEIVAFPN
jgi:hypothetical protein